MQLDEKSRLLLNLLQDEIPLVARPYKILGDKIGLSEDEIVARIGELKTSQLLRQISAIFNTHNLGYQSSLVACKAPPDKIDQVAATLNLHPGISHNYARNHEFNLWFTIAVPEQACLQTHLDVLLKESGACSLRPMPTLRLFKIGMKLDMTEGRAQKPSSDEETPSYANAPSIAEKFPLTEKDRLFVLALQDDMETRPDPFAPIARRLNVTLSELFDWCRQAITCGRLRRIAGIVRHRQAGFSANGMGVWQTPPERIEEVGQLFARQSVITHCYQRPTYPDWPYNLFTMIHGKTVDECDEIFARLLQLSGISAYAALYSHKEYKKIRLKYFTGEIEAWEKACERTS
ncbi:MAG: Lrp/AsnC family transcriptional regulator [Planctomycetota bacterium]